MKLLFICSRNRRRSPTAESIFSANLGIEVLSAGTGVDAETPISADLIEWADTIFAMQNIHKQRLNRRFPALLRRKKLVVLGIPDKFAYMDSELVEILREKVSKHLMR